MKAILFWSSGKDSAACYLRLRELGYAIHALVTTTRPDGIIPFHEVPITQVRAQALALSTPLWHLPMPFPTPNALYENLVLELLKQAKQQGVTHVVFGDIHLADIRVYRTALVEKAGLIPLFPLWLEDPAQTHALAQSILGKGIKAVITNVDPQILGKKWIGCPYDETFIASLPPDVDPCGEQGEFHTFVYDMPYFSGPISLAWHS